MTRSLVRSLLGHSALPVALAATGLVACGTPADVGPAPDGGRAADEAVAAADAFCPQGFAFDATNRLCLSATEAAGPFPPSMVEHCKKFNAPRPDGSNACETTEAGLPSTRWAKDFAINARLATLQPDGCARGTSPDPTQGYCSDGNDLYGPFSKDDVTFCKDVAKGNNACETNRLSARGGMVKPKSPAPGPAPVPGPAPGPAPGPGGFDAAAEIAVRGSSLGRLVVAIGHAEGTLSATGDKLDAYFGHGDSGLRNIGLWSCTVCGDRNGPEADQFYYEQFIAPEVARFTRAAGPLADHPMVAAAFFGLLVQSPDAALNDADADDLALVNLLARGTLSAPVNEDKLLDLLVRSWTVDGRMLWTSPDTGQFDGVQGRQDQLRRLRAYEDSLRAQGVNPYP
jgi:hypothetical protein